MSLTADHLTAYLARIGLDAPPTPDAQGLARLQTAHRTAIAFENLDIRLGRPILIDSQSVFEKLVTRRRGGYCFEQNRLFADMLALIGLNSRPLLARVQLGAPRGTITPRTHVLLLLDFAGEQWIADAGFGASDVPPLPLRDGMLATSGDGASHRLRKVGQQGDLTGEWLIERRSANAQDGASWQPQYAFDLAPVPQVDLEQCNHWTSTRPDSRFTTLNVVTIVLPGNLAAMTPASSAAITDGSSAATTNGGFASMTDSALSIIRNGKTEHRILEQPSEYYAALTSLFGLSMSTGEVASLPLFARP